MRVSCDQGVALCSQKQLQRLRLQHPVLFLGAARQLFLLYRVGWESSGTLLKEIFLPYVFPFC